MNQLAMSVPKQDLEYKGLRVVLTCEAFPEQYDVYHGRKIVGYFRLRHGHFTATFPDVGGELVYEAATGSGEFHSDEDRAQHLALALEEIVKRVKGKRR